MAESRIIKTAYFVRHGESADNVAPVFQSPDSPLNPRGRKQARRIGQRASRLEFEALIASNFRRAAETGEIIGECCNKRVEYSELFVERVKPTSINGKPYSNEEANATWRAWETSLYTPGMRVEDGENYDDVVGRADNALDYLLCRPEDSMLIVTHGYFLRTIVARVLLGDLLTGETFHSLHRHADVQNTALTVLVYVAAFEEDPAWRLWTYNDHAHLG